MIALSIQNVVKAFEEGNNILDGVTFDINEGERVGLLGKNGAGKTTLLKIITGEITQDEGNVVIAPARKLGLISQIPIFPEHFLVEDVLRSAFDKLAYINEEMKRLEKQMSHTPSDEIKPETLAEYDKYAFEFERLGGYTTETELARVVNGLQIPAAQRQQMFNTLSGGERTRINLARLILENTDILLLDEPTNHLDLSATVWLEEFLKKFKGTVVVISHDRYFLDRTINRVVELDAGKAEFYSGNYSFYVTEKQRRFEEQLERFEREQAEAKRLNASADRLQQWGIGNSKLMRKSFAIRTRAEKVIKTEKPGSDKKMRGKFTTDEFHADEVLLIKGLAKSYGGRELLCIDELTVKGGERIAVIGDNGTGKTTLARMIMGSATASQMDAVREMPDKGFARLGPSVRPAYLPQLISFDNPGRTVLDTLVYDLNISAQTARNRLGAFLFAGDDVFKRVGDLSGGEKSRLRLCMLMYNDINLLILDEPTNHLDLPSREWMENAIDDFHETLIFISHDRYFISRFATRIWNIANGSLTDFRGSYEAFTAEKSTAAKPQEQLIKDKNGSVKQHNKQNSKSKSKPQEVQKEIRQLEREIGKCERSLDDIKRERELYATDYEKLIELDEQETRLSGELDALIEKWSAAASA